MMLPLVHTLACADYILIDAVSGGIKVTEKRCCLVLLAMLFVCTVRDTCNVFLKLSSRVEMMEKYRSIATTAAVMVRGVSGPRSAHFQLTIHNSQLKSHTLPDHDSQLPDQDPHIRGRRS